MKIDRKIPVVLCPLLILASCASVAGEGGRRAYDGFDVHLETEIGAPAGQVWEVLAHRFGSIDEWSSTVEHSRPIERTEVPDGIDVAD